MVATNGQGNPNWDRDEIVLALHLYETLGGVIPSKDDSRLQALSDLLRSLPHHESQRKSETFRNIAGVRFKLQNFQNIRTGAGLDHTSALDRAVVEEFSRQPGKLAEMATRISTAASKLEPSDFFGSDTSEDEEFYEGNIIFALHRKRERGRGLRRKFLTRRGAMGLVCDICQLRKPHLSPAIQEAYFEAHHVIPLAEAEGQRTTKLSDLALLCACCHRAIHKMISRERRWIGIEEGRQLLSCE